MCRPVQLNRYAHLICVLLALSLSTMTCVYAVTDLDGDGLYDLEDYVVDTGLDPASLTGVVRLSNTGIADLDGASQFTAATYFSIEGHSDIRSIDAGDFSGLSNLLGLWMNLNFNLRELRNGAFVGLSNLQNLNLDYNDITSLESGDFLGLSNVTSLRLEGNLIQSVEVGAFTGLDNLETLVLDTNEIAAIPAGAFSGLSKLKTLNLHLNAILSLQPGDFSGLDSLEILYLDSNLIHTIESGTFAGFSNLRRLFLYDNRFSTLNLTGADFPVLTRMHLEEEKIDTLVLDAATLSQTALEAITYDLADLIHVDTMSLVGISGITDVAPLLNLNGTMTVDQNFYTKWGTELDTWDSSSGNTLIVVVPEPSTLTVMLVLATACLCRQCRLGYVSRTHWHSQ